MTKAGESVRDGRVCLLVRLDAAGPVSGSLWAAGYSGGRPADVQSVPLTLSAGETAMEEFTVKGETAKLFCLEEGTLRPLAPALTAGGEEGSRVKTVTVLLLFYPADCTNMNHTAFTRGPI